MALTWALLGRMIKKFLRRVRSCPGGVYISAGDTGSIVTSASGEASGNFQTWWKAKVGQAHHMATMEAKERERQSWGEVPCTFK